MLADLAIGAASPELESALDTASMVLVCGNASNAFSRIARHGDWHQTLQCGEQAEIICKRLSLLSAERECHSWQVTCGKADNVQDDIGGVFTLPLGENGCSKPPAAPDPPEPCNANTLLCI